MRKITDTYFDLTGEGRYIGPDTEIICKDAVARAQIKAVFENAAECREHRNVKEILFLKVDELAEILVKDRFPEADLQTEDSYVISVEKERIRVFTDSENGVRYAACSIRAHYDPEKGISEGLLCNIPICPVRGLKIYTPAREHIPFFREIVDLCMTYGYNTIFMEIGGAMEYKSHPEITEGWKEYGDFMKEYPGKALEVKSLMPWMKNSIHWENGGGDSLTQEEMKELAEYCAKRGLTVIPEVPSLSHSDYLLLRHPELAENPEDPFPDTYCPSNPAVYELLFDLLDEIAEVFHPPMIHIAHDEWIQIAMCDKCRGKDPTILLANDIRKIYNYLKEKGIEVMIWGDKLLDARKKNGVPHGGARTITRKVQTRKMLPAKGRNYPVYEEEWEEDAGTGIGGEIFGWPETYRAVEFIPTDLKIMNWLLHDTVDGQITDAVFHKNHLWMMYGNFHPEIKDWFNRVKDGVKGVSLSNWSMLDQRHMQRNGVLIDLVQTARMLWDRAYDETAVEENFLSASQDLFAYYYRDLLNKPHVEIIHGADFIIPHKAFVDGNLMNEEADKVGSYHIFYQDGSKETYPVFWGCQIGYTGEYSSYTREPAGTCECIKEDGKWYYKWILPITKPVERIVPEILKPYLGKVQIRSIKCCWAVQNREKMVQYLRVDR